MFEKAEKIAVLLTFIATVLISLEVGLGKVLMTLSLGSLALIYFYAGAAFRKSTPKFLKKLVLDETGNSRIVPNMVMGYAWSVGVIGILFTIQGFPGSEMMLYVGLIGVVVGIGYAYFQNRNKAIEKLQPFFFRILLISGIIGLFAVTPKKDIRNFFHTDLTEISTEQSSEE